jgi:hypothetical protein
MNLLANAKIEDVFRSAAEGTPSSGSGANYILLAVIVVVGGLVVASMFNQRAPVKKAAKALSNPSKLVKHLARQLGLKSRELKQLRQLAEQEKLENPLVLLLCPSVLQSAAEKRKALRAGR